MFINTHKHFPFFLVFFSLVLTACASGARAVGKTSTPTEVQKGPAPTGVQPILTLTASVPAVTGPAFGDGVLLYEWRDRPARSRLHLIDPRSGLDIPGYAPIPLGASYAYAISPDRKALAMVVYPSNNTPLGGRLSLIDLRSWQVVTTTVEIDQWNTRMIFSPDNQKLAITTSDKGGVSDQGKAVLVDISTRVETAQAKFNFLPTHVQFASDSEALMVYGTASWELSSQPASPAQVVLLSVPSLEVTWSSTIDGVFDGFVPNENEGNKNNSDVPGPGDGLWMQPAVVFAPDKDALYIIHAGEDRLTTVDFNRRKVQAEDIRPPMGTLDRLMALTAGVAYAKTSDGNYKSAAISPDGQRLYVIGENIISIKNPKTSQWDTSRTPLGLKVIRISDAAEVAHFDTQASDAAISADGNTLYLRNWSVDDPSPKPYTEIWSLPQPEMLARLDGRFLTPSQTLNSQAILLSNATYQGLIVQATLDARTFTPLHEWTTPYYGDWLIIP